MPVVAVVSESRLHQAVAESKARLVIGRDRELTTLLDFARGDIASLQLWSPSGQTGERRQQLDDSIISICFRIGCLSYYDCACVYVIMIVLKCLFLFMYIKAFLLSHFALCAL